MRDLDGFGRALGRYEALAAEVEQPRYAWVPAMFRAMRADWLGERERAERWETEARALRDQGNAEGAALVPARSLARALLHADVELLGRFVDRLVERAPQSSGGLWLSALLDVWRGQHDAVDREYWTLSAGGVLCRVGDSRGIRMLAQRLDQPGREIHVLDLSGGRSGVDASDAGEVLDARARAEYQRRLSDLRSEMSEASSFNDLGRHQRLAEEAEALMRELSRGFGLGGRARRSGSAVERARINVRRRITLALRRIRAASPELGERLEKSVRTGVFCVYKPDSRGLS